MPEPGFEHAPLVIAGCQRSGTTLLKTMLANHPKILGHPDEPQFILGLYHRFGTEIKAIGQAVRYLGGHPYIPATFDIDRFRAAFRDMHSVSLRTFVETYVRIWGGNDLVQHHPMIKHPGLIYYLDFVSKVFPQALIVHIVRDPRSNVLSQRNRWPQFSVFDGAVLWKTAVRNARSWAIKNADRYVEIKYEDLVKTPEAALISALDRAGLQFDLRMLKIDYAATVYSRGETERTVVYNKADPARIDLWRTGLSPLEIKQIEHICKIEMQWWDYRPELPEVPASRFATRMLVEWLRNRISFGDRTVKRLIRHAGWRLGVLSRAS
jgi:hypothetical protein